jgi:hypothetical protein
MIVESVKKKALSTTSNAALRTRRKDAMFSFFKIEVNT